MQRKGKTMSRDYFAYEHTMSKHADLVAQAEIERQLDEAQAGKPGLIARARVALGTWLIQLGEWLAEPVAASTRS